MIKKIYGNKYSWELQLKLLKSDKRKLWMKVATELTHSRCEKMVKPLILIMLNGKFSAQREAAAYSLAHSSFKWNMLLHKNFIEVLKKTDESPSVRAQVAEGVGNLYNYADRRTKYYKEVVNVLISCLQDKSPAVRFWSIYALGNIRAKQALPALKKIARNDKSFCPKWWAISTEAGDAIKVILDGHWPDRLPKSG